MTIGWDMPSPRPSKKASAIRKPERSKSGKSRKAADAVAGATDTTDWNCPDLVFAYFTENPTEITPDFFDGITSHDSVSGISVGDLVIASPKGNDGRLNLEQAIPYSVIGTDYPVIHQISRDRCFWIEHLQQYRPFSEAKAYWKEADEKLKNRELNLMAKIKIF